MNQLLQDQIKKYFGDPNSIPSNLEELFQIIDKTYTTIVNQESQTGEIIAAQNQLRQNTLNQEIIITNLKRAIAALEPNSNALNQRSISLDEETTYLTESLIQLVESHKQAENKLIIQKNQLEKLNTLLSHERDVIAGNHAKDQAVLEAIGDGLMVTDKTGRIQMINFTFEKLLGYGKPEVLNKPLSSVIVQKDEDGKEMPTSQLPHIKAVAEGKIFISAPETTHYYTRKNGTSFPVSITVAPISLKGEIIGAVEVFKDITKEKEIDKAKSEFVSLASHQLRTPLSSINWYTEMLIDEEQINSNPEIQSNLKEIITASNRMTRIVNTLLNVSRIELGSMPANPSQINIFTFTESLIREILPLAREKNIKVNYTFNSPIKEIFSDKNLLDIVIDNLLSNAVKYSRKESSIDINVSFDEKSNMLIFEVIDRGMGIPQSEQGKIFAKLYRASNVRRADADGNGLGLYITKSIVEALGGQIWFKSIENQGTSFYFTTPIKTKIKDSNPKKEESLADIK